jgi:hypothetical protein
LDFVVAGFLARLWSLVSIASFAPKSSVVICYQHRFECADNVHARLSLIGSLQATRSASTEDSSTSDFLSSVVCNYGLLSIDPSMLYIPATHDLN